MQLGKESDAATSVWRSRSLHRATVTVEVSRAIYWMDYPSVPAVQDTAKHLPLFELIGKMYVAPWCPPNTAITKSLVVPGPL